MKSLLAYPKKNHVWRLAKYRLKGIHRKLVGQRHLGYVFRQPTQSNIVSSMNRHSFYIILLLTSHAFLPLNNIIIYETFYTDLALTRGSNRRKATVLHSFEPHRHESQRSRAIRLEPSRDKGIDLLLLCDARQLPNHYENSDEQET